jgi:hypothetical protein
MRTTDSYLITCKGCGNNLTIETVDKGLISSSVERMKKDERLAFNILPEDLKQKVKISHCTCTPVERFKLVMNKAKNLQVEQHGDCVALHVSHTKTQCFVVTPNGYQIDRVLVGSRTNGVTTILFKEL